MRYHNVLCIHSISDFFFIQMFAHAVMFDAENKKLIASNEFYFRSMEYSHIRMTQSFSFHTDGFRHCNNSYCSAVARWKLWSNQISLHQMMIALSRCCWYCANFISLATFVWNTRKKFFYRERELSHFILWCSMYFWCDFVWKHHFAQVAINSHHFTWRDMAWSHFVNATIQQLILWHYRTNSRAVQSEAFASGGWVPSWDH